MDTVDFLSLPLTRINDRGLIRWLVEPNPLSVAPRTAAYLNAHTVNLALRRGSRLGRMLRRMDCVYADGMSVVRAARRMGLGGFERASGADFFLPFCWSAAAHDRTVALVGGTEDVNAGCADYVAAAVPGLRIVYRRNGFFRNGEAGEVELLERLGEVRPDITLLGLGSPRQEALALRLRDELKLATTWCVGALFEYYAPGARRRAPVWMRENGLEWAFRLSQEPRRLAGRYLLGNAEFLLRTRGLMK
jgi:N-acetylglucosaminyldiphosphoundecaprenol N-acetyl-beta-D-mannosaminyltransferase